MITEYGTIVIESKLYNREGSMAYIFLDESGDLGFDFTKKRTSNYFVITLLFCKKKRLIEKVVARTHRDLKKKHRGKQSVLHCYREKPLTRQRLLRRLADTECGIMTIYLNKKRVYTRLQDEKQVLYNYVTNILLDRIFTKKLVPTDRKILLIASRRETNKFLNENFMDYLRVSMNTQHKLDIEVTIKTPYEEKALQAVDFASWSIYRKHEQGDESYYQILKANIIEERSLFSQ